jgi:Mg-chelatase subunit ChlI
MLQNSWKKYGPHAFEFFLIEIVTDASERFVREQYWIDHFHAAKHNLGFNAYPSAGSPRGHKASLETRERQSAAHKGKKVGPFSDEHRQAISAARIGIGLGGKRAPFSTVHREAIRAAKLGTKATEETRAKLSALRKGKRRGPFSEQHLKNLREAASSDATRAKKSAIHRGRKKSAEHKAKISSAKMGKKRTLESRRKQSDSTKGTKQSHNHILRSLAGRREAIRKSYCVPEQLSLLI